MYEAPLFRVLCQVMSWPAAYGKQTADKQLYCLLALHVWIPYMHPAQACQHLFAEIPSLSSVSFQAIYRLASQPVHMKAQ